MIVLERILLDIPDAMTLTGSFAGGGSTDYSTSVSAMSVFDHPNRFVTYNDSFGGAAMNAC